MHTHAVNTPAKLHRVELVKNPNFVRNGLKAYGHVLRKFGFTPTLLGLPFTVVDELVGLGEHGHLHRLVHGHPDRVKHVRQRRLMKTDSTGQVGEVNASDVQNDSEYLAPVLIGTPAQTLNLDFDTGSSDLWVWSSQLPAQTQQDGAAAGHSIFNCSASSTFTMTPGQTWNITYGDGSSASGNVGTDTITIGGVTISNQAVEVATQMSPQFVSGMGDGLCGLAWPSINTVQPHPVQTPVQNMISQSAVQPSAELFTAYLDSYKDVNNPDKGQSFYTFGFIDQDVINSTGNSIFWTPVNNSNGF